MEEILNLKNLRLERSYVFYIWNDHLSLVWIDSKEFMFDNDLFIIVVLLLFSLIQSTALLIGESILYDSLD